MNFSLSSLGRLEGRGGDCGELSRDGRLRLASMAYGC